MLGNWSKGLDDIPVMQRTIARADGEEEDEGLDVPVDYVLHVSYLSDGS